MPDQQTVSDTRIIWWREKPVWILLALGFSAGLPYFLVFSSLSLWLREAGVERSAITFFSWAVLGYSFKFVWAPLIDQLPLPLLRRWLGRRRSWLLLSQLAIISAVVAMAFTDPQHQLAWMAVFAVLLGFSSATQDIVIDAYRIEVAPARLQALLASTYIAGYRIGMMVAVAGAANLAGFFGSTAEHYSYSAWGLTYITMSSLMCVGVLTTLLIREPDSNRGSEEDYNTRDYLVFFLTFLASIVALVLVFRAIPSAPEWTSGYRQTLLAFVYGMLEFAIALTAAIIVAAGSWRMRWLNSAMLRKGYFEPIQDFLQRYGSLAIWVLLLIGFYRISDIVLGVIAYVFYLDMGYTKEEIAYVTKVLGVFFIIAGTFSGGFLALRLGVMRVLQLGAVLVVLTNLLFIWLARVEADVGHLTIVIAADNFTQGLALAAFIAWLSRLTNVSFTATQYAIFSSVMTLFPKLIGGYSGTIVDVIGYEWFFFFASALGIPIIALIWYLQNHLDFDSENKPKPI